MAEIEEEEDDSGSDHEEEKKESSDSGSSSDQDKPGLLNNSVHVASVDSSVENTPLGSPGGQLKMPIRDHRIATYAGGHKRNVSWE